jgi:hypothetical protein
VILLTKEGSPHPARFPLQGRVEHRLVAESKR